MKSYCLASFLAGLAATEAFQSKSLPSAKTSSSSLFSTEAPKVYSKSLPFLEQPPALDGTYAGDVGFDPLNFAKDDKWLMNMREAEMKHARLAMLAAAGWPISELWDRTLADALNLPSVLDEAGRVPSVLNGGMGKIQVAYWLFVLLLGSAVEAYGLTKVNEAGYVPGDFQIDPLKLTKEDNAVSKWVKLAEIKNGRLAMVAITAYALLEFVEQKPVVESFSFLF
ncbi:unnamed protein product [Pseudo-nitzschia multistriata]|uniref:Plastid light harvesting protein n=1 Tax=Pseudo-nitzschia multistriata TaxID=183589 RepID=A0A448ZMH7_9STRA|nr:unnamed protein product [Pseudo-nitzschia multistriata]